ncbi:MAG: helix-hairpin-helix domain-containing protein [Roseiflexaceae bacterium]
METTLGYRVGVWLAWGFIVGGVVLVLAQVFMVPPAHEAQLVQPTTLVQHVADVPTTATQVVASVVYISGAVLHPGVYTVDADARVADVVSHAGGLRADADMVAINLAAPVTDGQHVHIVAAGPIEVRVPATGSATDTTQIAINTATAATLAELPGIGPALAERIVVYRTTHGNFANMEELGEVPGIGPALQTKLGPYIRFS